MSLSEAQFEKLLAKMGETRRTGTLAQCSARYAGSKDSAIVEAFLAALKVFIRLEQISDEDALTGLPLVLTDAAATWWQGVKTQVKTWVDFEEKLRHTFAPQKLPYVIYQELVQKGQEHETTDVFISEKRALIAQLPKSHRMVEDQLIDLVYGQLRLDIRERVAREHVSTFDALLEKAREVERHMNEKANLMPSAKPGLKTKRCNYCRIPGHTAEACRKKAKAEQSEALKATQTTTTRTEKPRFSCYGCGEPGVVRSRCTRCSSQKPTTSTDASFCGVKINGKDLRPVVSIKIGHIKGIAQIDTGARSNVASYTLYRQLERNGYLFEEKEMNITLADGISKWQKALSVEAPITIFGRVIPSTFTVLPQATNNITLLGVGFIMDAMLILNIPQRTCRFLDEPSVVYELEEESVYDTVFKKLKDEFALPQIVSPMACTPESLKSPQPSKVIPEVAVQASVLPLSEKSLQTEAATPIEGTLPTQDGPKMLEGADVLQASTPPRQYGPLMLVDLSTPPNKKTKLMFDGHSPVIDALYYDAKNVMANYDDETDLSPEVTSLFERKGDIASISVLCESEYQQLEELLQRNEDAFTSDGKPTTEIEHVIDTGNHKPISVAPYRLSAAKTQILRQEVNKMLESGVIQPCQSPWSAPVVMVPKKNGETRVCVDYRQLNAITTPDRYPLPRIDDLLHGAKPTPYMSTIDLQSGYWQIQVQEQDQHKTCFVTPFGTYKFTRMPFGLRNAPATFQRLMDRFRISLSHIKILVYIDDVVVLSETFERHLKDLQEVFDRLREYNLTINRAKCNFCCPKVKYLGHYITPRGLEVDPEKVNVITGQAEPKKVKHLLSFLQMCSWYRRFISNFAKKSEPLTRLTRKNAEWCWGKEQQSAFETLKNDLVSAPVLCQADENKPFIIKTDASSYAIGAVLVQGEREDEHPVEYASRQLTKAERNYSTTEREALAVVWAVNKFRGYIEGTPITILTDHQALKWLMTLKSPTGRLARWALQLQAYDITIKYVTGKTNVVADALSRPICSNEVQDNCEVCNIIVDMPRRNALDIRTAQLEDETIKKIILALEDVNNEENGHYWSRKGYLTENGVLYRYNPELDTDDCQLVVPKIEQEKIISAYHDDPIAGHYGVEKTIERISRRYFWKGMRKQIENYIKVCINCQRYKPSNMKPAGLLQTTTLNQRFEVISFDLFGPLPKSADDMTWIFIIEDCATRWVELFALQQATAQECAKILIDEIILRYGTPRRFISDNGSQFVSGVMQQMCYCLNIKQGYTPLYHPETNPVERRNRDLKTQLAILVGNDHSSWPEKLPSIRFAMNTAISTSTGYSPAYLTFGRNLRTPDDVNHDLKAIIEKENFIPEITPKLIQLANTIKRARETTEMKEEQRKDYVDEQRKQSPRYKPGDHVMVDSHVLSSSSKGFSAKLAPRRDGPYLILRCHGPSSFEIADPKTPDQALGLYHSSALRPFRGPESTPLPSPAAPLRKRGRPKKVASQAISSLPPRKRGRPKKMTT